MNAAVPLTEVWRGPVVESLHFGHALICGADGDIIECWGDPNAVVYPRSSAKMIQALPLIESGAAEAYRLSDEQLALACASHQGAAAHTDRVASWLKELGHTDDDLRCGPAMPQDRSAFNALVIADQKPCQMHNNCSGKHAGFLTLSKHLGGSKEYIEIDHPVQKACLAAFEDLTEVTSPGYGLDGCSAPNFLSTMHGMGRAMGWFAAAKSGVNARQTAAVRLREAMIAHPFLVAGERRACTELMRACHEPVALKTGAEGYFVAIAPTKQVGVALKILDGSMRAANCTIAALLVRIGVLDAKHPTTRRFMHAPVLNKNKIETGSMRPVAALI